LAQKWWKLSGTRGEPHRLHFQDHQPNNIEESIGRDVDTRMQQQAERLRKTPKQAEVVWLIDYLQKGRKGKVNNE